jgi:hypothetical protein
MKTSTKFYDGKWIGSLCDTYFSGAVIFKIDDDDGTVTAQYVFEGTEGAEATQKRCYKIYETRMNDEGVTREYFIMHKRKYFLDDFMARGAS